MNQKHKKHQKPDFMLRITQAVEQTTIGGDKSTRRIKPRNVVLISTLKPMSITNPQFILEHTNAIKSWKQLDASRVKIVIVGDDEGTAEMCHFHGLINEMPEKLFGIPTISSILKQGYKHATDDDFVVYINGDMILDQNFLSFLDSLERDHFPNLFDENFLFSSRRWNWFDFTPIDFENDKEWYERIKPKLTVDHPRSIDIFIHKKNAYKDIPDFVLGRFFFDTYFIEYACLNFPVVVECTGEFTFIHQFGVYHHQKKIMKRDEWIHKVPTEELEHNKRLYLSLPVHEKYTCVNQSKYFITNGKLFTR